jgi:hypothetical protein
MGREFPGDGEVWKGMESGDSERLWAWEEFGHAKLGDERRRDRVVAMAHVLAGGADGRVSQTFRRPAERQGAYDLLEGGRVSAEALLEASTQATVGRSAGEMVFVPIDGTSIQVIDRRRQTDLGLVGTHSNDARGLNVVTALSVAEDGTPLGICAQTWWNRPTAKRRRGPSTYRPVEQRESRHTVETIRAVARRYDQTGCMPWVVIDRGGDATVVIDELLKQQLRFTIRASWDRRILGESARYVRERLSGSKVVMRYDLRIPRGYERRERTAKLQVQAARVQLNVSHDWKARRENPTVNVLLIRETRAPGGEKALDWLLYTNAPIKTNKQIALVIRSYVTRWRIEDFHKTWKSGHCNVEGLLLRSTEAAKTWATLLGTVAARIERLKHLARNEPDQPASVELTDLEIEALKLMKNEYKKKTETIPDGVPPIGLAVQWIAELGGYTGKSSGGPPGSMTIARGLDFVSVSARAIEAYRSSRKKR